MRDYNRMIVLGRVGGDVELRRTKSGVPVAHFSVATARVQGTRDESRPAEPVTEWHRVVVWGAQGEACAQGLHKGDTVLVEGELRVRTYQGNDQKQRTLHELHAQSVSFLGKRKATAATTVSAEPLANGALHAGQEGMTTAAAAAGAASH